MCEPDRRGASAQTIMRGIKTKAEGGGGSGRTQVTPVPASYKYTESTPLQRPLSPCECGRCEGHSRQAFSRRGTLATACPAPSLLCAITTRPPTYARTLQHSHNIQIYKRHEAILFSQRAEEAGAYLGQFLELVGIQKQLLKGSTVAVDLVGDCLEGAVPLVHRLDVAVASPQGNTLQHVLPPGRKVAGKLRRSTSEKGAEIEPRSRGREGRDRRAQLV